MSLTKYQEKRNFTKTPEPKPINKKSIANLPIFVIQEHHASHLHYDFRLEAGGVLLSWAVPKEPSMDSSIKRLAVRVEDHPPDYASFQGIIPEGNYGAGKVSIWDEGEYDLQRKQPKEELENQVIADVENGELKFNLYGKKLTGSFALIKLKDKKNWLLIKHKDHNNEQFREPINTSRLITTQNNNKIKPMLATLVDKPFSDKEWLFEIKWDGYRAIAQLTSEKNELYSRNGNDFSLTFPSVFKELEKLNITATFDGELVVLDNEGRSKFELLQNQGNQKNAVYYIFDLLSYQGEDLTTKSLITRKKLLKQILPKSSNLFYSDHILEKGAEFFTLAKEKNLEGIIAKKITSAYLMGVRSNEWLKIKLVNQQEVIIIGTTTGNRKAFGSLVTAVYRNKVLQYAGLVGSGFTDQELNDLDSKFSQYYTDTSPLKDPPYISNLKSWLKPELIAEVKYSELTESGLMRQPIFLGLRIDKDPKTIILEKPQTLSNNNLNVIPKSALELTHLDKVFWPIQNYTKRDVVNYYTEIAEYILPYLKDRPQSLNRFPNGIDGDNFFQKDINFETPSFVEKVTIYSESAQKDIHYLLCQNLETLLYMVNLGCIEINPWNSRIENLANPDYLIFDLDPESVDFKDVVMIALEVKELLTSAKLTPLCKTTGGRGLHIFVPLNAIYTYEQIKEFAEFVCLLIYKKYPKLISLERNPKLRQGQIYLDYLRNAEAQTTVSVYSLRPRAAAAVSTPLSWDEVNISLDPTQFNLKTIPTRLKRVGDLWKPMSVISSDLGIALDYLSKYYQTTNSPKAI